MEAKLLTPRQRRNRAFDTIMVPRVHREPPDFNPDIR